MSATFTTLDDALAFLFQALDYERITKYKYDIATFNLERMEQLLAAAGKPHHDLKFVHVTGTKGKGSTSMILATLLKTAGLKVGLYTSPHLVRWEERIVVGDQMIPAEEICAILDELRPYVERERVERPSLSPSFFELMTAIALLYFRKQKVDMAVMEVGLGGRLDATNVVLPEVSVITNIGYDHMNKLGDTLAKIAAEKAGIIKPGVPVISAAQEPDPMAVIERTSAEKGSRLYVVGKDIHIRACEYAQVGGQTGLRFAVETWRSQFADLFLPALGRHQAANAAAVIGVAEILADKGFLTLTPDLLRTSFRAAKCPGRIEVLPGTPTVILDSAHTIESVRALKQTVDEALKYRRLILVTGIAGDKDVDRILGELVPWASEIVFTRSDSPRASDPQELAHRAYLIRPNGIYHTALIEEALDKAKSLAAPNDLICVTGSFYVAGKIKEILEARADGKPLPPPAPRNP